MMFHSSSRADLPFKATMEISFERKWNDPDWTSKSPEQHFIENKTTLKEAATRKIGPERGCISTKYRISLHSHSSVVCK